MICRRFRSRKHRIAGSFGGLDGVEQLESVGGPERYHIRRLPDHMFRKARFRNGILLPPTKRIHQSEKVRCREPAETPSQEDVGDDGCLLIEIIQRGGGYDDHLLKNRPEEPDGPVNQSLAFDTEIFFENF